MPPMIKLEISNVTPNLTLPIIKLDFFFFFFLFLSNQTGGAVNLEQKINKERRKKPLNLKETFQL